MATASSVPLAELYERDETAWLDINSELIREGRLDEVDFENLAGYLADMAIRDRRDVASRFRVLIAHLLKWRYQPDQRSGSWHATILHQRDELESCLESGSSRRHATEVLAKSYTKALKVAAVETGHLASDFPAECPSTLDEVLDGPLDA